MKFGVREICDVVLRAKETMKIGNDVFAADEPVIYFDSAKTSTVESAATTVYATGGRGNSRLLAWEGEKTVTFTMEDALLSPMGFAILSGAGLVQASDDAESKVNMHTTLTTLAVAAGDAYTINIASELTERGLLGDNQTVSSTQKVYAFVMEDGMIKHRLGSALATSGSVSFTAPAEFTPSATGELIMLDFYIEASAGAYEMTITPDKFGGYYYLEASTLFRRQDTGVDMAASFVIPKVKIQSNFTFSMASSGDPSTFTFTMDAFPDYTKFDKEKQVLFALQILE